MLSLVSVYHIIYQDSLCLNLVQLDGVASDDLVELVDVFHVTVAPSGQQITDGLEGVVEN